MCRIYEDFDRKICGLLLREVSGKGFETLVSPTEIQISTLYMNFLAFYPNL